MDKNAKSELLIVNKDLKEWKMDIEELKKEYATQDNRATAYPIYVQVQELICIGVIADGYSVLCPFGDGEERLEHDCDSCDNPCFDEDSMETEPDCCVNDRLIGYIWHPVEFFLTTKGAEEYIDANKHNHGKLRIYIDHFDRRNYEMRDFLRTIGFKVVD